MKKLKMIAAVVALLGIVGGCVPGDPAEGLSENDPAAAGIAIYYQREILNGRNLEIVTEGVRQLRAMAVPSGEAVIWSSDNPGAVSVNETGRIRASKNPGRKATITATLRENPAITAEVSFTVMGLR